MCERVIEKLPSMTAEERMQLRRNCERAVAQSRDHLVAQEARRVLRELEALEHREVTFLSGLPAARRIEYAFRRLPASPCERDAIRSVHEAAAACATTGGTTTGGVTASGRRGEIDEVEPAWHRPFREMYRQRRHLLQACEVGRDRNVIDDGHDGWLAALVETDAERRSMRLRPEAEAAFTSLGYFAGKPRTDATE